MGVQHDGALSMVVTVPVLLLNGTAVIGLLALVVRGWVDGAEGGCRSSFLLHEPDFVPLLLMRGRH